MLSEKVYQSERRASKIILHTPEDEIVFVAGKRGMLNLPGGGIDEGETSTTALYREIYEELGLKPQDIETIEELGGTWGDVTTADGEARRAVWHVHEGGLLLPLQELVPSHEITGVQLLSAEACLNHDNMSALAKRAVLLSLGMRN